MVQGREGGNVEREIGVRWRDRGARTLYCNCTLSPLFPGLSDPDQYFLWLPNGLEHTLQGKNGLVKQVHS